jgi:hypothetical protein
MGLELLAPDAPMRAVLTSLGDGYALAMIDGALVLPTAEPPPGWRELRLRTPAGMVTLVRRPPDRIAIVVFGNAGPELVAVQQAIAKALSSYDSRSR